MPGRGVILSLTERLPKFTLRCDALPLFSLTERLPKFSMREDNSVSNDVYVRVSPSEVQWITDDIGVIFTVRSNAEWEVLIDGKDAEDDTVLYRLQNSMIIANNTLLQNKSEVITQLTNMDSIVNDTKMRNYEI